MERAFKIARVVEESTIPRDVVVLLLSGLSFKNRLLLRRVCKAWKRYVEESTNELIAGLALSNSQLVSLRFCKIWHVKDLSSLSLCGRSSLPIIAEWTQLQTLALPPAVLRNVQTQDLTMLCSCSRLQELTLQGLPITSMSALSSFQSLTRLCLLFPHMLVKVANWEKNLLLPPKLQSLSLKSDLKLAPMNFLSRLLKACICVCCVVFFFFFFSNKIRRFRL